MTEGHITAISVAFALVLVIVTLTTAPRTTASRMSAERGEALFPQFHDPSMAASLEIAEFDPRTATVHPFKVQNHNGRWTIPSQHDYPADATDQLSQTAAALIALKKDDTATDNAADYERCGVLDPLDTTLRTGNGRGTRVTVRGAHEEILAEMILGKPVEAHPGFRFIRLPNQKRLYISNVGDLKLSTAFGDWIDRDLLQIEADDIDAVNLRNYSLDRESGTVRPGETLLLQRGKGGGWTLNGLGSGEQLNRRAVDDLRERLATLRIAAVLPKPPGITATLNRDVSRTTVTAEDKADLARKGFHLTASGQLVSDRGEIVVRTRHGVFYTLRFGDIAPSAVVAAGDAIQLNQTSAAPREHRYLFITADFDSGSAETAGRAAEGARTVPLLRARFAPWYYVISADSFATLHVQRRALIERSDAVRR